MAARAKADQTKSTAGQASRRSTSAAKTPGAAELRRERDLAGALENAAAALIATLDFEQVLDRILDQVQRVVPCDASNIMLIEGDKAHTARWHGYERFGAEEFISTAVFCIPEVTSFQQMLASGEPIAISDTATHPGWIQVPEMTWLRSYVAVPIAARDEVTEVVDTLGAGDAFAARFLVEHLGGADLRAALAAATVSAGETCGYYGALGHGVPL